MEFQIGELSEEHQKYDRNTHANTYTNTHTHSRIDTQQKKLPAAEAIKKAHI